MSAREDFHEWLRTRHREAGRSFHDGEVTGKLATWSSQDPLSLLGAFWVQAVGAADVRRGLADLAGRFSDCVSYSYDLVAAEATDDMAYTVAFEHATMHVDGRPAEHHLRVTEVYRREAAGWRVVHRHADPQAPPTAGT